MAITTRTPEGKKGLVHTIYQFEEDAPAKATRSCGEHGVNLAAHLAALTDATLRVTMEVSGEQPEETEETEGIDYEVLAEGLDQYREVLRAMVAGLVADGFTYEQARRLVTHLMTQQGEEQS